MGLAVALVRAMAVMGRRVGWRRSVCWCLYLWRRWVWHSEHLQTLPSALHVGFNHLYNGLHIPAHRKLLEPGFSDWGAQLLTSMQIFQSPRKPQS